MKTIARVKFCDDFIKALQSPEFPNLRMYCSEWTHKIESDGTVRNSSNMKIGSFDRNNVIRDASNMKVGSIDGSTIRDKNNMKIGSIESNGTVRDASNMKIGSVESNGTVRDGSNMKIGRADGVNPIYAAVFYFFNLF